MSGPDTEFEDAMARHKRVQLPGFIRHVMSRGNGRMRIFLDDADHREFIHGLATTVERFELICWNYCLMPNHYHVTLQPIHSNLSEAIRSLNSVYAQWWNRRHERVGHVFQGRFKDQIVDRNDYLLVLSRYVVMNPVRSRLVEQPEDWRWSSYSATIGRVPCPPFLASSSTLGLFGDCEQEVVRTRFASYVKTPYDDDPLDDRIRSNERILGSASFKGAVRAQIGEQPQRLEAGVQSAPVNASGTRADSPVSNNGGLPRATTASSSDV